MSQSNTARLHDMKSSCSFAEKSRGQTTCGLPDTYLHACSKQCVTFRWKHICEVEYMFSKMGFIAMSSPSFSPSRVREPLLFLPPTPHPRRFSRANWKTSVIILVLAQIWWDQRWPAGRRRGADGCMLRGTKQRPFRF